MNIVWPITALYFSVFAMWGYFRLGRGMTRDAMPGTPHGKMSDPAAQPSGQQPTWQQIAISDSHCGAGCTLGDIIAEFSIAGRSQESEKCSLE